MSVVNKENPAPNDSPDNLVISQAKEIERLTKANQEIVETHNESKKLLRVLCHDLSNSLTVILGAANRAVSGIAMSEEKNGELWKRVHFASMNQRDVINHVMDILKTHRSGKIKVPLEKVSLNQVIDKTKIMFESQLKNKDLTLTCEFHPNQELFVMADSISLFNSVFNNVISNAIKFSFEHGVIAIVCTEKEKTITVDITDHGTGMEETFLAEFLQNGRISSQRGTKGEKGTGFGMGLFISYLEKYGAKFDIVSRDMKKHKENHGTTISMHFVKP